MPELRHREAPRPPDRELRLLLAAPDRLCAGHWARAIRFAAELGRVCADYAGPVVARAIEDRKIWFPMGPVYLDLIIRPSHADGVLGTEEMERWRRAFETGDAERDPRVQAFVSAQAGRISQIVAMVVEARDALSRYLETTAEKIPLRGVEPGGVAVFEHDRARFVVVDQRVGADHGRRPPASGCGSCPIAGVRASDEFLGFVIHTLPG